MVSGDRDIRKTRLQVEISEKDSGGCSSEILEVAQMSLIVATQAQVSARNQLQKNESKERYVECVRQGIRLHDIECSELAQTDDGQCHD